MKWLTKRKEYWQPSPSGFKALFISIVFLLLGLLTLWFMRSILNMQQDAVLVAILLVPVLIFLILSGKLLEINAGGVSAKFSNAAQKPFLNEGEINTVPMEEEQIARVMKQGLEYLQTWLQSINGSRYIVLTVTLGNMMYRDLALLDYLRALSQYRALTFLVILEQNQEIFAYTTGWQAIQILELHRRGNLPLHDDFVMAISEGRKDVLLRYGLVQETVKTTETNISILQKMTDLNIDVLIVTDEHRKLKGVVERTQILSKLILALTK